MIHDIDWENLPVFKWRPATREELEARIKVLEDYRSFLWSCYRERLDEHYEKELTLLRQELTQLLEGRDQFWCKKAPYDTY